jgi:hypothetical protein
VSDERNEMAEKTREDVLSALLTDAFDVLFEISEWPNRAADPEGNEDARKLAAMARHGCAHIERFDPDKDYTGP